jgi:hypothetical protein
MEYEEFLASKRLFIGSVGFDVALSDIHPQLFDWQKDVTRWAIARGRAALFEDCGLGKTIQQVEWARIISQEKKGNILILAPLAVADQTIIEARDKLGVEIFHSREGEIRPGITITNYERLHYYNPADFIGVVLDESSILKSFDGKTRKQIQEFVTAIPYRLACTATPAPNDLIELTNHAEFLDIMTGKEIIALFFVTDGNTTHEWRLKGHAKTEFYKWMAQWAVAMRMPSDLGYDNNGFILPELKIHQTIVNSQPLDGQLFTVTAQTLQERLQARRNSLPDRVQACAELVNNSTDTWVIWCNLNRESNELKRNIPGSVEIVGSDSPEFKERELLNFAQGKTRVLITKPSIAGFGMNWQHCHNVAFVGLSDSYEQFYQAVRRCWRFGQKSPVDCYVIVSEAEGAVVANINRKENQAMDLFDNVIKNMSIYELDKQGRQEMDYNERKAEGENWELYLGDSCEIIKAIKSESIGLSVFSPPFPGMYAYTNSARDIGNSQSIPGMIEHFKYLMPELLRITMPGRLTCIHLMQLTAMKTRDGYIGIKDYRGAMINLMESCGWRFAGEVTIDKNPQVQATRNKERGLLFKSLSKDSAVMRMALADYLLYFRKDGENPIPIHAGISDRYNQEGGWITEEEWIEWAAPVWYRQQKGMTGGIRETDVLNVRQARDDEDERHLCPLQLGVIERAVKLWSAPGDTVFSPFAGIGSEGFMALKLNRKFIGIELKPSYWEVAQENLQLAIREREIENNGLFAEVSNAEIE